MSDLRALAARATPGPWEAGPPNTRPNGTRYSDRRTVTVSPDRRWWWVIDGANANADAAWIAACDPQTILRMLDRIEELERLIGGRGSSDVG